MVTRFSPLQDGPAGVAATVDALGQLKTYYGRLPVLRTIALRIIAGTADADQEAQLEALASFVRGAVVYVCDPVNVESITTPDVLLLEIARRGFAQGDCDDHCLLFASLAEAIGIPVDIVGVTAPGGTTPDHVICVAHLGAGDLQFDLVAKFTAPPLYTEMIWPQS